MSRDQNEEYRIKYVRVYKEYSYKNGKIWSYRYYTIEDNGSMKIATSKEVDGADSAFTWYGYKRPLS